MEVGLRRNRGKCAGGDWGSRRDRRCGAGGKRGIKGTAVLASTHNYKPSKERQGAHGCGVITHPPSFLGIAPDRVEQTTVEEQVEEAEFCAALLRCKTLS
jgi:hypothetical protein